VLLLATEVVVPARYMLFININVVIVDYSYAGLALFANNAHYTSTDIEMKREFKLNP
tara:strand:+ start:570 stop:740 length:171 start_codon:yes stop_codon:yes gene_type:complete